MGNDEYKSEEFILKEKRINMINDFLDKFDGQEILFGIVIIVLIISIAVFLHNCSNNWTQETLERTKQDTRRQEIELETRKLMATHGGDVFPEISKLKERVVSLEDSMEALKLKLKKIGE